MIKKVIFFVILILLFFFLLYHWYIKPSLESEFEKVQKIYNEKGIHGFCKYLEKNSYIALKDSSKNGATPLLLAVRDGDIERVNLFLRKGALLEEKDFSNKDVLDYSLENNDSEILDFLISKLPNSYWNDVDLDGNLLGIKIIVKCSNFDIIKKVIDLINNINSADNNSKTPLMYATQCNTDVRIVKYLLDKGADIDMKNNNEWTALMYATRYNPNPYVIEDLIIRGANTNSNSVGLTILMLASCNPNPGVLLNLLEHKNDVNVATNKGKTALMYACENKQDSSVIKILIENNADLNAKDKNGKTALMYALENYSNPESIYIMLSAGANVNDSDNTGKSVKDYLLSNKILSTTDVEKAITVAKSINNKQEQQESNVKEEQNLTSENENNVELGKKEVDSEKSGINTKDRIFDMNTQADVEEVKE